MAKNDLEEPLGPRPKGKNMAQLNRQSIEALREKLSSPEFAGGITPDSGA
jgi:hypothetical protein